MQAFLKGGSTLPQTSSKQTAPTKGKKRLEPWVEKYRPRSVEDVSYQEEVVAVLKKSLQGQDLPNLLFYGPPGTGKTSTILAAARGLFGDMYRTRILELNASDERGINVVRDKVKSFSQLAASGVRPDGRPCPPFKIVILDEADSMTKPAQAAMRRTMEKESRTTRFCLICNYVSRIIEPITSRCAKFRFKPLVGDVLEERLRFICEEEKLSVDTEAIQALLHTSDGDMRKAITTLQSAARLKSNEAVSKEDIYEIAGVIPGELIQDLMVVCQTGSYEKLDVKVKDIISEGYSAGQIILQFHDHIVPLDDITDQQKAAILERLAVMDKRLMDGADEYLQVMDLLTLVMMQLTRQGQ